MSSTAAGWLQFALLFAALAACYVPLGNYMAHIFTSDKDWRVERGFYRLMGIDSKADQKWSTYVRSILAFSAVSVIFLYGIERLQHYLPLSVGMAAVTPDTAWNTAASFVTNTNWQNYAGESTMSYLTQMTGLTVQQFMSAAVGLVVAIAMIRGFTRSRTDKLGNFWVDVTRAVVRLLIPLSIVIGLALIAGGAIDNFNAYHTYTTLSGAHQTIVGGPVGSMESIKDLGNNGGGFFNTNAAHPFENPNPFTDWLIDLQPAADPIRHATGVRQDGRGQPAGLRAGRGHGHHLDGRGRRDQPVRGAHRPRRHRHGPRAPRRGRYGDAVRHARLLGVRRVHHGDLHWLGQLLP